MEPVLSAVPQPVPARLHHEAGRITADWADIAGTDPGLPFFDDRIAGAGPAWRAELPLTGDAPAPAALILHTGRCGSTLVSRSLSLLTRCHVVSEPQALNDVLSVDGVWPFLPAATKVEALRRVVGALARIARPDQDRFILKLSSWNALHLPLLDQAFPGVPKLFVYRRPDEILVSLQDRPAGWMRRAAHRMQAGLFLRGRPSQVADTPLAFAAQVLGRILAGVVRDVERQGAGDWLLVPYEALPQALTTQILPWLGLIPTAEEADRLAHAAGRHAKDPTGRQRFEPDGTRKRAAVTADLAALARDLTDAHHDRLEHLRLQAGQA
ncbi:aspartyl/asparaginyl beta-hydroxylase [Tistrella mobilis]|uniref:aspartyl/asparaginyl beta-hydroxylase n=1 Tax=Tistrella mobilis TaxID=171437 RepID=UPI0035587276